MASNNGTKKFLQQIMTVLAESGGFDRNLSKVRVVSGGNGKCIAEMTVEKEHTNRGGTLHGGLTATLLLESCAEELSNEDLSKLEKQISSEDVEKTETPEPNGFITQEMADGFRLIEEGLYLSAAKTGDEILINAEALKVGRTLAFLNVDITNKDSGAPVARGSHTKYIG
ncbi:Acyl-coenzyme A thioesterase 13-like [Homarus americanus]|uniref:Acyl-coenzyme A thioesterase 13-like n=1 Tax=Homarus americanus TaxID=6706 RepID=A0A8J5JRQ4_HOMAM|nr:Acyl-coenzyme A thioesterase 13-like [Homarus americanus]